MSKPSEAALKAAREILSEVRCHVSCGCCDEMERDAAARIDAAADTKYAELLKVEKYILDASCGYYCIYDEDEHQIVHAKECLTIRDALRKVKENT